MTTAPGAATARRIRAVGDIGILIEAGSAAEVHGLATLVAGDPRRAELADVVPGARTLYLTGPPATLRAFARRLVDVELPPHAGAASARLVHVDVRYDGPDLPEVAARLGLSTAEVIELHTGLEYEVQFFGFSPGQAFFAALPDRMRLPRRPTPRVRVPSGSVAIANEFTVIYPQDSPGGWNLIGTRVSAPLWDSVRVPPNRVDIGDRVRFRAVR